MSKLRTISRAAAITAISGLAATAGVLGAASNAEAITTYTGKVTANGGLTIRTGPSSHVGTKGGVAKGATVKIDCKVVGTNVDGNRYWYALSGNRGWVSARYVANVGAAPKYCPANDTERGFGKATTGVNLRQGPSVNDVRVGSVAAGVALDVTCYALGQSIHGNQVWYHLTNGSWVSAQYAKRVPAPATNWVPCAE